MTNDTRTADDIERDIEDERAQMSGTINDLQKKFSVEAIVGDIGAMFRGQGGEMGRAISQTIGRNPAAVALVGVGLAWLVLGQARAPAFKGGKGQPDLGAAYGRNPERAMPRPQAAGRSLQEENRKWFDDHLFPDGHQPVSHSQTMAPATGAAGRSDGIIGSIRNGADAAAGAVSDAAGSVRDMAVDLTERLASGTGDLPEDAKARVVAARRMAHDARTAAQEAVKRGGRAASSLFEDQPLVVGALAVALGAALGGLLPHSQIEDDTLGATSERLFADAQQVFQDERAKAMAVIRAAAAEAKDVLKDTGTELADLLPEGKSAGNVIVDHIGDAANRVSNTARNEAESQGFLGDRQG